MEESSVKYKFNMRSMSYLHMESTAEMNNNLLKQFSLYIRHRLEMSSVVEHMCYKQEGLDFIPQSKGKRGNNPNEHLFTSMIFQWTCEKFSVSLVIREAD